jgi:hypothetical protein
MFKNCRRLLVCEQEKRESVIVLYIQKIEVVGSEVSEKRVWVQRLAQMEKKAG